MKKMFTLLIFALLTAPLFAAGSATVTCAPIADSPNWQVTVAWTGDASTGSVPATTMSCVLQRQMQGMIPTFVEIKPGSPSPTASYSATLVDANNADIAAGTLVSLSATASAIFTITAPPLNGALTFNLGGNSVASATGTLVLTLAPGNFAKRGGGGGGSGGVPTGCTISAGVLNCTGFIAGASGIVAPFGQFGNGSAPGSIQWTANAGSCPSPATNSFIECAPASIATPFSVIAPSAAATGIVAWTNSSNTVTASITTPTSIGALTDAYNNSGTVFCSICLTITGTSFATGTRMLSMIYNGTEIMGLAPGVNPQLYLLGVTVNTGPIVIGSYIQFNNGFGGYITQPANGVNVLQNNALTGYTRLDFGGTTSSFAAIGNTNQTNPIVTIVDATGGATANLQVGNIKATTGQRFVCVDTNGTFVSSATACVGT